MVEGWLNQSTKCQTEQEAEKEDYSTHRNSDIEEAHQFSVEEEVTFLQLILYCFRQ